jgi:sugar phosphate isomerase/epimerase
MATHPQPAGTAHPRLSVNSLSSLFQPLAADISLWRELGVDHVGLISPKLEAEGWEAAESMIRSAGLRVSNISTEQHVLTESLHLAASLGAGTVYICSGPAGPRPWEEASANFCKETAPMAELADRLGVRLAVEPTNPLRADVSFVYSLRDAVDLAASAGIGVVVDLYSCWYERHFDRLVRDHVSSIGLVQVCDYALGTYDTPNRVVPGDGDIPIERRLATVLEAGYPGVFDLEVMGPRVEAQGYRDVARRSVDRTSEILARLGA